AFPLTAGSNNIVVAAAYQRLIDLYDLYQDSTLTQEYKGGVDVISPGAAIQIVPEFAIGAAFNIWTGSVDYTLDYEASDNNDVDINNLAKFSGFNINIGALATFDKFKIGAVAKTPLSLTEKWKPADTEFEYKFKFPMTFGFGISFQPNDNLTLAADVDVRPYSNTDIEDVDNDTTYTAEYDNTTQFRVGLEYLVITESNVFPVRLGFHTDPLIQNPFYPLSEEKTTGLFFSGGFGVIVGNIWFDAAYELGMLKATLDNYESTDGTYNYVDNLEYKEMTHNIILSAIVHF
ncbi:MAG: type IX secretion system membrane protein PorP/SprF, partial [candidate division Zixibacteria bacterium]|nr:type IX secretion system membrane protein PorP/SprF [candidate division Zixibacteria bacterium]